MFFLFQLNVKIYSTKKTCCVQWML